MARVVMEQTFEAPLSDEKLAEISKRLDPCLEVRSGWWARSYLSNDRKRMFCEFEAPDADSVREAARSAGVPFDRVWTAQVFDAADYPEHAAGVPFDRVWTAQVFDAADYPEHAEKLRQARSGSAGTTEPGGR
jgi:hypothetical protein